MADQKVAPPTTEAKLADGTTVAVNDHVYLTPEHLGESYYIGRIMEFCASTKRRGLHARIAWFNRPRDVISRKSYDPRLLVATMHSDVNPVSAIRGKCTVTHRSYIPAGRFEEYKRKDDHFYYHQLYDRYMQRVYDIVPSELVQNIPTDVQQALCDRYQFVVVEQGKVADLTVTRRTCCVCRNWCASASSVKCAACQKNYHMSCIKPPLLRKPPKGFAWQCAFCTRQDGEEEDEDEEEQEASATNSSTTSGTEGKPTPTPTPPPPSKPEPTTKRFTRTTRSQTQKSSPSIVITPPPRTRSQLQRGTTSRTAEPVGTGEGPQRQFRMTNMWPFRYIGVNTDINDVLDIDDRIYPRARSRLGNRYQVDTFPDLENETPSKDQALVERDESPAQPFRAWAAERYKSRRLEKRSRKRNTRRSGSSEPAAPDDNDDDDGYFERGSDATVTPLFVPPANIDGATLDQYMADAKALPSLPLPSYSADLQDRILLELERCNYDTQAALQAVSKLTPADFEYIVDWTKEEVANLEKGVTMHGHDLYQVGRMVPTKRHADVVRFFFRWKKTDRYEPVYSQWTKVYKPAKRFKKFDQTNAQECKGSISPASEAALADGDSSSSHSASINGDLNDSEASETESGIEEPDPTVIHASPEAVRNFSCTNCHAAESRIWRRLPTDIDRKRKIFRQVLCNDCGEFWLKYSIMRKTTPERQRGGRFRSPKAENGSPVTRMAAKRKRPSDDAASKSRKLGDRDSGNNLVPGHAPSPCAICRQMEPEAKLLTCRGCGMSAHNDCYGANLARKQEGWNCDVCTNKKNPAASYAYQCILCSEPRSEPRQPLKKTAMYNWVHVLCAMFMPEIKFVNTESLQPVEYVSAIKPRRFEETCHLCNIKGGVCVGCQECQKPVHVQCAFKGNSTVAFEVTTPSAHSNEAVIAAGRFSPGTPGGVLKPRIWCPEHRPDIPDEKLIDLSARTCDTNEAVTRLYANLYKHVEPGSTPATRRYKAVVSACGVSDYSRTNFRLVPELSTSTSSSPLCATDAIADQSLPHSNGATPISSSTKPVPAINAVHPACSQCPIRYSPYWWKADATSEKLLCQRCYWSHCPNLVS